MKECPAFSLYAEDFLTGVMYLTNEEKGIYITMLCKQWTDKKIPKKRLGLLTGLEWEKFSDELKSKFIDHGDFITNKRLEDEREKKSNFIEKQRENGKKGGRPSLKKKNKKNPNQTQINPNEIEIRNKKNEIRKKEKENDFCEIEIFPTFEDFWDEYDKKTGKEKSIKLWNKINQSDREKIMGHIPNYKLSQPDKKYRKNPETYLNNKSWNDEIIISNNGKQQTPNNGGASQDFRAKTAQRLGVIQPE